MFWTFLNKKKDYFEFVMATTTMSIEDRVSNFIEDILKVEDIRESFNVFLVISNSPDVKSYPNYLPIFFEIYPS